MPQTARAKRIGIYCLDLKTRGGGSEKKGLVLAQDLSQDFQVVVFSRYPCDIRELEQYYGVELARVEFVALGEIFPLRYLAHIRYLYDIAFNLERVFEFRHAARLRQEKLDVFLNNTWASNLPGPGARNLYLCMFPHVRRRWLDLRNKFSRSTMWKVLAGMTNPVLDSYQLITANSQYTAGWVERRWRKAATVIYSSVELVKPEGAKKNWILSVGRFVFEKRPDYKGQRQMIETFLRSFARDSGWELHLAGSVDDELAAAHLQELQNLSVGYPIVFHPSPGRTELCQLYQRASVYWHAMGVRSSRETNPESHEHFGQTTVEAMSAGAVPVVIDSAGQRESVRHEVDGYRWNTLAECAMYTKKLIDDPELRAEMSRASQARSQEFSRERFLKRVRDLR